MESISNYQIYSSGMKKSVKDKLFFDGLVEDVDTIIDFGCADGQMLKQIHSDFPEYNLFGIDMDQNMLDMAKKNCDSAKYIMERGIPVNQLRNISNKAVFNLSSVIHEVYSYSSIHDVFDFWKNLFDCGCKYIAIRDLMLSADAYRHSEINDVASVLGKIKDTSLYDFIRVWGNIDVQNNLLHYLMKYRYKENWNRELNENYFPITIEQLLSIIPTDKYKIVYFSHYVLPFNRNKIFEDFGIEIKDNTHVKILLERK